MVKYKISLIYDVIVENADDLADAVKGAIYNLYHNLSKDEDQDPRLFDEIKARVLPNNCSV